MLEQNTPGKRQMFKQYKQYKYYNAKVQAYEINTFSGWIMVEQKGFTSNSTKKAIAGAIVSDKRVNQLELLDPDNSNINISVY